MRLKKSFSIVLYLLILSSIAIAQIKSDKEHNGLLGNVHKIQYEVAKITTVSRNPVEGKPELQRTEIYDKKGNLTERIDLVPTAGMPGFADHNGKAVSRHLYDHYKNGQRVEYAYPIRNRSDIQIESTTGRMDGSFRVNWSLKFDANGNRLEEEVSRSEGPRMYRNVYSYDSQGRRTEMSRYGRDNKLELRRVYSYDDKGSISEVASYKADGILIERLNHTYEYDQTGNWVRRTTSRILNKEGRAQLEPVEVTYRIISYYQ